MGWSNNSFDISLLRDSDPSHGEVVNGKHRLDQDLRHLTTCKFYSMYEMRGYCTSLEDREGVEDPKREGVHEISQEPHVPRLHLLVVMAKKILWRIFGSLLAALITNQELIISKTQLHIKTPLRFDKRGACILSEFVFGGSFSNYIVLYVRVVQLNFTPFICCLIDLFLF